ncbi:hypothetical protein HY448_00050 [Candidatus Pacearchaeota archaeon]|nr:hypothetical protein [Candidatus Pacearchaeota archaeon]
MNQDLKDMVLKSGTTLIGIVCKDGVVMASDKRTTLGGNLIVSKISEKTVRVGDYFLYAGCGAVSTIQRVKKVLEAELKLKELKSRSRPSVKEAANLLSILLGSYSSSGAYAGTLFGGINEDGTMELYTLYPDGAIDKVEDYDASLGSGMAFVLGLLERQYKKGISVEEGVKLATEALKSSTQRDTGSGNGMDVFTITKDGIKQVVNQEIRPDYESK